MPDLQAVPIGQLVHYRNPAGGQRWRFMAGHRVRLFVTSDDQDTNMPAMLTFRHASVGTQLPEHHQFVIRLMLPVMPGERK